MGEVVGAGLLAHVPTIVLPEKIRRELNNGEDTTLVPGLQQLRREVFDVLDYDTVVVLDSHWATTVEFVVTAHERRSGLFTSEELPRGMTQRPYDIRGDPDLAHLVASKAGDHSTWITAIDDPELPIFYATTNVWEFLGDGLGEFGARALPEFDFAGVEREGAVVRTLDANGCAGEEKGSGADGLQDIATGDRIRHAVLLWRRA